MRNGILHGTAFRSIGIIATGLVAGSLLTGCGPSYEEIRRQGVVQLVERQYVPARYFFIQADEMKRNEHVNLHDLGFCCMMLAQKRMQQGNRVAALAELDRAIEYFDRATDAHPGYQPALIGKNMALEFKGEPEAALDQARWAARVVGPQAQHYLFLAAELDQRGDVDEAFLRYGQAVRMEPGNSRAHAQFARFLLKHGHEAKAVAHLRRSYRINPLQPWVKEQLVMRNALPRPLPAVAGG